MTHCVDVCVNETRTSGQPCGQIFTVSLHVSTCKYCCINNRISWSVGSLLISACYRIDSFTKFRLKRCPAFVTFAISETCFTWILFIYCTCTGIGRLNYSYSKFDHAWASILYILLQGFDSRFFPKPH